MKKMHGKIVIAIMLVGMITSISCDDNCMVCVRKDFHGIILGEEKMCGKDLETALENPKSFECQ